MFCDRAHVASVLAGKTIALVGSGPSVMNNAKRFIDSHDVVIRVNNHKLIKPMTGTRTDVHYSYYGNAIRKSAEALKAEGVALCMCKCPDDQVVESEWHRLNKKLNGIDFRYIYELRRKWWFCPTYVPTRDEFMAKFHLLGMHMPTTGFAALLDILSFEPLSIYLTGFDFFSSGVHNVNEKWRPGNPSDPIGHRPDVERAWIRANLERLPITLDEAGRNALVGATLRRGTNERRIA